MTQVSELEIRKAVRERYAKLASGAGDSCCSTSELMDLSVPSEAGSISDGSGDPLSLINPTDKDTIVDLGSGGGVDVFRASSIVKNGKVIGVDATPEMIWRARETAAKHGYTNVDFRLGEIEHLPIESTTVDFVISNCVINLAPNKEAVLKEASRVLKPGGRFAVADIAVEEGVETKQDLADWCACEGGAISLSKYRQILESSGFKEIQIQPAPKNGHSATHLDVHITATKQ